MTTWVHPLFMTRPANPPNPVICMHRENHMQDLEELQIIHSQILLYIVVPPSHRVAWDINELVHQPMAPIHQPKQKHMLNLMSYTLPK